MTPEEFLQDLAEVTKMPSIIRRNMTTTEIAAYQSVYQSTSYRPDREYIDGFIRERNVGKWEHARMQWLLAGWFGQHEKEWNITGSTEQRMQVTATRVRIPDLVIMRPQPHQPDVIVDPPLLVIEILSPDDTLNDMQERLQDYFAMGIETVWIVDGSMGWVCTIERWIGKMPILVVPGTPIKADLPKLYSEVEAK